MSVSLDKHQFVELTLDFDVSDKELFLDVRQSLLGRLALLSADQEVEFANVRAVGQQLVYQHAAEVASSASNEYILAWKFPSQMADITYYYTISSNDQSFKMKT